MIKKALFLLVIISNIILSANAQQKMVIKLANGESKEYYIWDVDKVSFEADTTIVTPYKPTDAVDLGLSVKWSPVNIGANTEKEQGWTVGWGDITGKNKTTRLQFFPTETPPSSIVASASWDIATALWQDKWRMPTDNEVRELIDSCIWTRQEGGWMVTAKNNDTSSIFLPDVTIQVGGHDVQDANSGYWTGMLSVSKDSARALTFNTDTTYIDSLARYTSLAIRPVYGDYNSGVTVTLNDAANITTKSVLISFNLSGELDDINKVYLCYSSNPISITDINDNTISKKELNVSIKDDDTSLKVTDDISGFEFYTTYYYYICVETSVGAFYSKIATFKTKPNYQVPEDLGLDAVDLGLPSGTKWAPFNMGASSVGDWGGYYGWGDGTGTLQSTVSGAYGPEGDICNIAKSDYDIASYQWKGDWYTPDTAQIKELYNNCSKTWTSSYNGSNVCGWIYTGPNGNSIFIPAGGYTDVSKTYRKNADAYLWTSLQSIYHQAYCVGFNDGFCSIVNLAKYYHLNIRPVKDGGTPASGGGGSSDPDTPSGGGSGGGSGSDTPGSDTPSDPVTPETPAAGKAIDLGLSVLWADCNVGSTSSNPYGTYLGWGELEHTSSTFLRSDYKYTETDNGSNSVYNSLGLDDLHTTFSGDSLYDVASKEWGGTWRMPTEDEVNEMLSNCTITFSTSHSVPGYDVTGNGQTIFLPAGGRYYDDVPHYGRDVTEGYIASYWTSSYYYLLVGNHPTYHDWCYYFEFSNDSNGLYVPKKAGHDYRYFGRLIRPVKNK